MGGTWTWLSAEPALRRRRRAVANDAGEGKPPTEAARAAECGGVGGLTDGMIVAAVSVLADAGSKCTRERVERRDREPDGGEW